MTWLNVGCIDVFAELLTRLKAHNQLFLLALDNNTFIARLVSNLTRAP